MRSRLENARKAVDDLNSAEAEPELRKLAKTARDQISAALEAARNDLMARRRWWPQLMRTFNR